jgi:hypothetical protein
MRRLSRLLLPLLVLTLVPGCEDPDSRPPEIAVRTATVIERRATLSIFRRAWEDRPRRISDAHCWYERRLLNRMGFFGRSIRHTETHVEACQFWLSCLREHMSSYDDETYKDFKLR